MSTTSTSTKRELVIVFEYRAPVPLEDIPVREILEVMRSTGVAEVIEFRIEVEEDVSNNAP